MRGAQFRGEFVDHLVGIIPACAGSTTGVAASAKVTRDHPRMCGEHGRLATMPCRSPGSSPHVRGAQRLERQSCSLSGIIPACAGSTSWETLRRSSIRDHPRMCGEHSVKHNAKGNDQGSSPHVRGARRRQQDHPGSQGIIPACAGSTPMSPTGRGAMWDHPRMCGEHVLVALDQQDRPGSSPHVRGAL